VVRFNAGADKEWVGNLQPGAGYTTKLINWPHANAVIVIANGAVYVVRPDDPGQWAYLDLLTVDCHLAESGETAILSTYTDVVAVLPDGSERWRRNVAVDGVEVNSIEDGLIHGSACDDPPGEWQPFTLRVDTGDDA